MWIAIIWGILSTIELAIIIPGYGIQKFWKQVAAAFLCLAFGPAMIVADIVDLVAACILSDEWSDFG